MTAPSPASGGLPQELYAALAAWAASERPVMATDFDGVLAPLVQDPMSSRPQEGTIEALTALAAVPGTTVAAVSGRDLDTLSQLSGLPLDGPVALIGSHGAQSTSPVVQQALGASLDAEERARLERLTAEVTALLTEHPLARLEHKPAGVVVHTRGLPEDAATAALDAARALGESHDQVRVVPGKSVLEMSVSHADKGTALAVLADDLGAGATAYLGDDRTDEDVFVRLTGAADVSIKVGEGETAATHRVDACELVPTVLRTALELREAAVR